MVVELVYFEFGDFIDVMVIDGKFISVELWMLVWLGLVNYFVVVIVLFYCQFYDVVENFCYDVEWLLVFYLVSYEIIVYWLLIL